LVACRAALSVERFTQVANALVWVPIFSYRDYVAPIRARKSNVRFNLSGVTPGRNDNASQDAIGCEGWIFRPERAERDDNVLSSTVEDLSNPRQNVSR
jgi:hypothetical protein